MTLRAIVFLTLSALLLTSCSFDITPQITSDTTFEATSDAALVSDGTLMICDVRNVAVLGYPPAMTSGSPLRHSTPALETLLRLDANGNILPCLAVAWQSTMRKNHNAESSGRRHIPRRNSFPCRSCQVESGTTAGSKCNRIFSPCVD